MGAALALFYWRHKHVLKGHSDDVLRSLGVTLALNLGYSLMVKNIDNWWVVARSHLSMHHPALQSSSPARCCTAPARAALSTR